MRRRVVLAALVCFFALLAVLPVLPAFFLPGLLPAPSSSPVSLHLLAVGFTFAGLAMTFDILHGYTGLLAFGHVMWFAMGLYLPAVLMIEQDMSFVPAVAVSMVISVVAAAVVGSVSLRVAGMAFALVTLAFSQAFYLLVRFDPLGIFGGDEGITPPLTSMPSRFAAITDTRWVYWFALAVLALITVVLMRSASSRAGRVWIALRENPVRVESIGLQPFTFRITVFVLAASLAFLAGVAYLALIRAANPGIASPDFALLVILMVTLGGAGRLWGAALGGFLYGIAQIRLGDLSSATGLSSMPDVVAGPVQEPLFVLGVVIVVLMLITPNGLAGLVEAAGRRLRRHPV